MKGLSCLLILTATLTAGCAGMNKTQAQAPAQSKPVTPIGLLDTPGTMFGKSLASKAQLDVQAFSYAAKRPKHNKKKKPAPVQASAPTGAWGDLLHDNLKCIAVSPDLLDLGLTRNTKVKIHGLEGEYLVLDTMSKRWTKSIDIYQGNDQGAAMQWGSREVRISWDQTRDN